MRSKADIFITADFKYHDFFDAENKIIIADILDQMLEEFRTTSNDSAFIASNSDQPLDNTYHKKGTLPFNIDSAMFSAAVGTVMGPFDMNGVYSASKLIAVKSMADSVKARHILLKVEPGKTDIAKATADSIIKAIKGGAKFEDMATKYSIDQAANAKGGDLGWFNYQMMVEPFSEACFSSSKGALITAETQFGLHVIEVSDMSEACQIANVIAAEHLEICAQEPQQWADKIRHAGAIFMGSYTSESLGDYCAGPNHVLPTARTARFSSPLGVYDFMKRSSLIEVSEAGAQTLGPIASTLAHGEGLQAHARAAEMRLKKK